LDSYKNKLAIYFTNPEYSVSFSTIIVKGYLKQKWNKNELSLGITLWYVYYILQNIKQVIRELSITIHQCKNYTHLRFTDFFIVLDSELPPRIEASKSVGNYMVFHLTNKIWFIFYFVFGRQINTVSTVDAYRTDG